MKRVAVNSKQSHLVEEEASARFKQQRLLEDYLEVQKEFVSRKKKLQTAKQKRDILLAEVSFLRRRHKYLKMQSQELEAKQGLVGPLNSSAERKLLVKNGDSSASTASLKKPSPALVSNPILADEDWSRERKEPVVSDPSRLEKKCKNGVINEKRVAKKKKISWQDQVALKV
ncbi:Ribosomal RNA small subunit methyltransferase G [Melia azedarach]|uniref:Ribosomal RNA small subunit methyltransferase G n=1 Tax=Melia azedarach TaxID=155640 RepID=A0ACC1X8U7_MELAZ|nr:Ribosomal RNA small subunit methyltransferase G [Melia azedarach]